MTTTLTLAHDNHTDAPLAERLTTQAPKALAVLRIMAALVFLQAGIQIIFNFPAFTMPPATPLMHTLGVAAGWMELIGAPLVLIGLFTRPVAFILSGQMAVGYWVVHAPISFFPGLNMGGEAILFSFIFLYLVFAGPGAFALDNRRG